MDDWDDIARDNLKAAQLLADNHHFRSCANRAYYAAFSAVSFALRSQSPFGRGRETPAHYRLTSLIHDFFAKKLRPARLRDLKAKIRRLYNERINADYRSGLTLGESSARESRRDAHAICQELGVIDASRS